MTEILALLQAIASPLGKTTFRLMSQVIFGMLVASGRITMLGLSRWTEKGGSYRTIQRFYPSVLPWKAIQWMFFRERFLVADDEYIVAGDEVVVSKAGKETHGLDRFFSGIQQRVIPSLSFFAFSLVNVREERSYLLQTVQVVKSAEGKVASKIKAEAKKVKKTADKKKPGRPKGSKNKDKQEVVLNAELLRIQKALKSLFENSRHSHRPEIYGAGWPFWKLSECLHGQAGKVAPDFQAAFRCSALSRIYRRMQRHRLSGEVWREDRCEQVGSKIHAGNFHGRRSSRRHLSRPVLQQRVQLCLERGYHGKDQCRDKCLSTCDFIQHRPGTEIWKKSSSSTVCAFRSSSISGMPSNTGTWKIS